MTPLLDVQNVAVEMGGHRVADAVTLSVAPGEIVGLVGANGSGKTSLLRAIAGLARHEGHIHLGGVHIRALGPRERAKRLGYLPQERIVGWNLAAWRIAALGVPLASPARSRETAERALARVGLAHIAARGVLDLSGGERARVLLARLLATGAPLLVADEPVAGLDPDAQLLTLEVLRDHAREGGGVLVTLHDLSLAAAGCDRLGVLCEGRMLALGAPREVLTADILTRGFGLAGAVLETPFGPQVAVARSRG